MNAPLRWLAGATLVLGGGLLTAALSVMPWRVPGAELALLRLAWSGRPERLELCRQLTDAELEGVPVHMRRRVQCEGRSARYGLEVTIDDSGLLHDTLLGGGARNDRPIHLLRDISVTPGAHRLGIIVRRLDSLPAGADTSAGRVDGRDSALGLTAGGRDQRERQERARARHEALPAELRLDTLLAMTPGEVLVVTYDADRRALVALRPEPR
jgi:hypothetical protein